MKKIAILNDTHTGIRNSSDVFLNNAEKFYTDVFFPYLMENGIRHIVHLGDYFDNRKHINFRALNRNRGHFLSVLREHGITMDIICGNHDTFYKDTNDLNSLKELLGHYMNEVNIIHKPTVMRYGNMSMGLVPWITQENEKKSLDFLANADCDWIGGHFDIIGFEMLKGVECDHGLDRETFSRFEKVLSGHFHTKSEQGNITYLGSQLEFTWSDAHDDKFFHVIDTDTRHMTAIHNPHTLYHKISFDSSVRDYGDYDVTQLDNKFVKVQVIKKTDQAMLDNFVERIGNRPILDLKVAERFDEFSGSSVSDDEVSIDDTATLVNSYIDSVDTELDKAKIKDRMNSLMVEAQVSDFA